MIDTMWYDSLETDVSPIISSRVRLARNIEKYPFGRKLTQDQAKEIVTLATNRIDEINKKALHKELAYQDLEENIPQQLALDRHLMSARFLFNKNPKAIFATETQEVSLMVNEEDHIRIQAIRPGRDIFKALAMANEVDDLLERQLDFSFDTDYGYLTACPTNVGTGLRASYLMHLPCLANTKLIDKMTPYLEKRGFVFRGLYGEGTAPLGNMYQLSNQVTHGLREADIVDTLEGVATNVLQREEETMHEILAKRKDYLEDKAYRAYAILATCRRITLKDAMAQLSAIRLGFHAGVLDMPKPPRTMYQLNMDIQPAHLQVWKIINPSEEFLNLVRATFLKQYFKI